MNAGNVQAMSAEHNFVFCATPWVGMAEEDIGNAVVTLQNFSRFPALTDRLQQSFVDFMYLGRLLIHPDGFSANPAFQDEGRGVIDTRRLFYDGNSQGGIFGGALTALAPDFTRAVLGVPGMNYSTLLRRSVDFDLYSTILNPYYPSLAARPLILSMVQMLWDRSDPNGYAHHITDDPLPGTPSHKVLMQVALGDHQVANVTAEVEARTIGARLRTPAVDAGPLLRQGALLRHQADPLVPVRRLGVRDVRHRPGAPRRQRRSDSVRRPRRSRTFRRVRAATRTPLRAAT